MVNFPDAERDFTVTHTAGAGAVSAEVTGSSTLSFSVAAATDGEVLITYDGSDGDAALDPPGLANEDLDPLPDA